MSIDEEPMIRAFLGHVYGRAGDKPKALRILEELSTIAKQRFLPPIDFAVVYSGLGDLDSTFRWLEKAFEARATRIHELPSMYFDTIRSDRRYADLVRRVGLPS